MLARRTSILVCATAALAHTSSLPSQSFDAHRFATPQPGSTQKLAFDLRRERMVRVDGSAYANLFETWEWLANAWSLRHTASKPTPRSDFSLGYDELRRRIVLFGGRTQYTLSPAALLDDTWEYDGIDWVQLQPAQRPPAQAFGWLGFDYAQSRLFLCGGTNAISNAASWHFDGTTWTPAPTAFVSAVVGGFASDPVRQRVVGYTPIGSGNLMCEWDGTAWSWVTAAAWPTPRTSASLTWVLSLQSIVLHSGTGNPAPADLWTYDGTTWNLLGPAPARDRHALAVDPVHGLMFAVGGYQQGPLGTDTLLWDGNVWSRVDPGLGWEDLRGAWFDGIRQRVVALSIYPASWLEWDGAGWSRQSSPVALVYPRGAFDPVRNRTVVVGSNTQGIVTQEWDGTVWTPPLVQPLPCTARPTFDPSRGKLVASCGASGLWQWNGTTWSQFANGPGAPWSTIADGECVYDAPRAELVQVQWQAGAIVTARWNGATWNVGTSAGPAQRSEHAFAYHPLLQRVVLSGGTAGTGPSGYYDDWWEWDGTSWTQRVLATTPAPRARGVLVYDEARQQMLLFSGQRDVTTLASVPFTDTWTIDPRPSASVMSLGPGCSGANGPLRLVPSTPHAGAAVFDVEAHGAFANAPCMFGFAFQPGAVPIGAACTQWLASQEVLMFTWCDAAGIALVSGSLPLAALGTTWAGQAAVLDSSNALGVTLSDGVLLTAGY